MADKRTFTIQGSDLGFEGGRYKSVTPAGAARKAAKQLFRMVENKLNKTAWHKYAKFASHKKLRFIVRESTRGSKRDTFYYEASVEQLDQPRVIKRNGTEYTVTKAIKVKTCSGTEPVGVTAS